MVVIFACKNSIDEPNPLRNAGIGEPDSLILDDPTNDHIGPASIDTSAIRYLALGDSYTIGQGVAEDERWPVMLAEHFRKKGYNFPDPSIIARSGWTTGALLSALYYGHPGKYDLVSLLIGVNNQYIGRGIGSFQRDMAILLDSCKSYTRTGRGVFVLSIPDYGATPYGEANAESIGEEIDAYNAWIKDACYDRNIPFLDITEISRMAKEDPDLLASDLLHPSGKMYQRWVDEIQHVVETIILRVKSD
jgi:lysophospholipase L1-like esterase